MIISDSFFGESLMPLTASSDQVQATIASNPQFIKTKFYMNFALMNCGTFQAIFISFVNVTGLKP